MTLDCNTTISWYQIYFNAPATGQSITTPTGLLVCVFFFFSPAFYTAVSTEVWIELLEITVL